MAKDSWLTVNPMAGEGNATLTNSGTIHKGRLERQTVVTAVVKGIEAAKSYQVKQEPTAEYITLDKTSFDVGEGASTITVSGKSNSPKITFSLGTGNDIPIVLPANYTTNGLLTVNGTSIPDDPGAVDEFVFSMEIPIPKNTVGKRTGKVSVTGSTSSVTGTVTITQATSTWTVTYSKGDYINTINKTSEKINWGGTATAVATLLANTAQYTYSFTGWYEGDTKISSDLSLSVPNITANRTFTAIGARTLNRYTLSFTITPTGAGTVSGGGTYDYGLSVKSTATPATGYNFTKWVDETGVESTTNPYPGWEITKNRTIQAVFTIKSYSITLAAQFRIAESGDFTGGTTGGTVSGGGAVTHGTSVTAKATPATGYSFAGWYEGSNKVSDDASYTFSATGNRSLTARFQRQWFTVTYARGTGVNALTKTTERVAYNGTVTSETAVASTGYNTPTWTKTSGTGTLTVTAGKATLSGVQSNCTLTASATINTYAITYTKNANIASISKTSETVNYGGTATCTATLPANTAQYTYSFGGWYEGSTQVGTALALSVANITAARTFEARGVATVNKYTLTVVNGSGSGTYDYGTKVTITASTIEGKTFSKWSDGVTTASREVTVTANATYTAEYTTNTYTVTYVKGTGIATISKTSETVSWGANATGCTATVTTGYTFDGWYNGATCVSTSLTYAPTAVKSNLTLTAKANINSYTVSPSAYYRTTDGTGDYTAGTTGGTVSGGGSVNHGGSITVTASAAAGYKFDGWYSAGASGGTLLSSSASYAISGVTASMTVYARFTRIYYTITYSAGDYVASLSRTSERVAHGANAAGSTMTVNSTTVQYSYGVDGWYNGSSKVTSSATYAPTGVTANATYTAKGTRSLRSYTVTYNKGSYISSVSRTSESVSYGSNAAGSTATVMASDAQYTYGFDGWYNGSTKVSTSVTYAPTNITGALTLEARGTRTTKSYTISVSLDSSAAGRGSVSGGGSYNYGASATVVCTKTNSQDVFDGWYEGSTCVSTSLSYTFTVTGARTLVAKILYLDVTPTSLSYGSTGGSQTFKITTNTTWKIS